MARYFNFNRLIDKYSREFTLISENKGHYDSRGEYVKGEVIKTILNGAILGFSETKIHRSEGTLTAMDKVLYMKEPLDNALINSEVRFNDCTYRIEVQENKDNAEFTGVYSYTLKHVSAFDGGVRDD